ncbi:MAG TPA: endo alpha-1,4 polygalactosaminidase [Terriglobales bacterium]|nr:endo alpha-1,4 polygalactosaminidase [Terriglobales bacterium]
MRRALPLLQSTLRLLRPLFVIGLISNLVWAQTCPVGIAPKITSAAATTFTEGTTGTFAFAASGNPVPTLAESGALPQGVSFRRNQLRGAPQSGTAGVYRITISAANGIGAAVSQSFTLTVKAAPITTPTPPPTPVPPPVTPPPTPITGDAWIPPLVTSWQWQLSSSPSASSLLNVQMYDVDGFDATAALVAAMHAQGTRAVCYIDAGTWENWRSDAGSFPASVLGSGNGWPGEKWLDIRSALVRPLMTARFAMCKSKGFDAVEPDNIDGYTNGTGFPLTSADQITYNEWIASTVHSLGMSVALKNDTDQVNQLEPSFDFMIDEQCFQYNECNTLTPFVNAGKAVFEVEYSGSASNICPKANALNFNTLLKDLDLTATRTACR